MITIFHGVGCCALIYSSDITLERTHFYGSLRVWRSLPRPIPLIVQLVPRVDIAILLLTEIHGDALLFVGPFSCNALQLHTKQLTYNTVRLINDSLNNLEPLFTKRSDALPRGLVKSWSRAISFYTFPIALTFSRHIVSSTVDIPVKIQNDAIIITFNIAASRLWR